MKRDVADTSILAFKKKVEPTIGTRHAAVLRALEIKPQQTNTELAEWLNWKINQVTGRVHELAEAGILRRHCKRPCLITGEIVKCWEVNFTGLKQDHLI